MVFLTKYCDNLSSVRMRVLILFGICFDASEGHSRNGSIHPGAMPSAVFSGQGLV